MKRFLHWVCAILFILLCIGTIWFLAHFMRPDMTPQTIEWQTAVSIGTDGLRHPLDYTVAPQEGDSFHLETILSPASEYGNLVFETTGLELTVTINGSEVWHSDSGIPEGAPGQAQASIPMPFDTECLITMTGTVKSTDNLLFPPLLRFVPVDSEAVGNYAYANYYGIPTGITTAVALLIAGLFLLGLSAGQVNWRLIPLFLAASGLTLQWITKGMGTFFLRHTLTDFLNCHWFRLLLLLLLTLFLILNQKRNFRKCFGIIVSVSISALLSAYIVSAIRGGYFAKYLSSMMRNTWELGYYDDLLYWLTNWLIVICTITSAYSVVHSFIVHRTETETLRLRNELILKSYHIMECKMKETAALRHETRHWITALNAAFQEENYTAMEKIVQDINGQGNHLTQTQFTKNFTINTILQDAAYRSASSGIEFEANVTVPEKLTIPEKDLCELLMNMLDNAIEAANSCSEEKWIRFQTDVRNGFLAVKCENSFSGTLKQDKSGIYLTTKADPENHGFGLKLMNTVAERYCSILDITISSGKIFTLQTALKLPNS